MFGEVLSRVVRPEWVVIPQAHIKLFSAYIRENLISGNEFQSWRYPFPGNARGEAVPAPKTFESRGILGPYAQIRNTQRTRIKKRTNPSSNPSGHDRVSPSVVE